MTPHIEQTAFGLITIEGEVREYDVLIRLDGQVKKRKKKLSKAVYGTSHILSAGRGPAHLRARSKTAHHWYRAVRLGQALR